MRFRGAFFALGVISCTSSAWSQTCTTTFTVQDPASLPPVLIGKVAYEDESSNHQIYVYDFNAGGTPSKVPSPDQSGLALSGMENPVFLPDGSGILFAAVSTISGNAETDLFYWNLDPEQPPANITSSMGNHRDEDVKFSPDGESIVWKQNVGIVTAKISWGQGTPVISNPSTPLVGSSPEASAPVYSPDQKYIYYYVNASPTPLHIERYDFISKNTATAFPQDPSLTYYYPADPDLYNFMYVSWLPPTTATCTMLSPYLKCYDKIYVGAKLPAAGTAWNATDCAADNSDPAPVDADHFIYSRDNNPDSNTDYELYLGEISTGKSWSLSALNISGGSFVGANYYAGQSAPNSAIHREGGPR
jgi:hypothetical protein